MKRILFPGLWLLLAAGTALSGWALPPSGGHKVQVRDAASRQWAEAQGGHLIADYGGFQLYDMPATATNRPDSAELRDNYNSILLNTGHLDTTKPEVQALRKSAGAFAGRRMHLVQFAGPIQPAWRQSLLDAGVRIVSYIPQNTYLIYGDSAAISKVQALAANAPRIQWEGEYQNDYKIHPNARVVDKDGNARQIGTDRFAIQLMADPAVNAGTLQLIDQLKLAPLQRNRAILNFVDVVARLSAADLAKIAARPDVVSIQALPLPKKVCERADQILAGNLSGTSPSGPGYLAWLTNKGFTQAQFTSSAFVVDVSDSGIDNGTTAPNHFGLYVGGVRPGTSRVIYNILEGTPNSGSTLAGCDGHGNINTHIAIGYDNGSGFPYADTAGFHYGLGVCPFVNVGSSVIFDPDNSTSPDDTTVISTAYNQGARISNNSWGDSNPSDDGSYNIDSFEYDLLVRDAEPNGAPFTAPGNQEMVIVFAAGNDGPGPVSVSPPGTAKNVITVGAAQNVQPFGGVDGSGVGNSGSDNADAVIDFSGRGPTDDGRMKPDLVAPGTHISGGAPQEANPGPDGTALACFLQDGSGVSGGVGTNNGINLFYPNKQQFYTASSGTSHSTPCVTGGCALVRQYFINNSNAPPSPAMTKAFLMNSARYLTGTGADDTLWSTSQGMGEMDLGLAFDGTPRMLRDEVPADLFTASGQTRVFAGVVGDSTKPFRVTLAWTDAPGSTSGAAYNNDLDLTVTLGGVTYKGNFFNGSNSVPGGSADTVNNVESLFLPPGAAGRFTVTITAASINSLAVPNGANSMNQDFALVVFNSGPAASVAAGGYSLTPGQPCTNGAVNPGEQVTVNLVVQNVGSSATTNLVGALLPYLAEQDETAPGVLGTAGDLAALLVGNHIALPSGPKSYGALAPGTAGSNTFTFIADGSCGQTITATLQLQDGEADLGTVSYEIPLGLMTGTTNFLENFDGVTPPALPTGWSSSTSVHSGLTDWVTENTNADSAPNAAFCPDGLVPGEVYLYSPTIAVPAGSNQLVFRNEYNLEDTYDGGVLEIAIGNSAINSAKFADILEAGGSFVEGAYNGTITDQGDAAGQLNPLNGRQAWTGNSGGFLTTIANLPAAANGTNIQLRWALGTDFSNAITTLTGWTIDSVAIDIPFVDCSNCTPANPTAPTIYFPTNNFQLVTISPVVVVTGQAPENSTVSVLTNGATNLATSADANGVYTALATLTFGTNVLTAMDGTNTSAAVTVVISLGPPTLDVPAVANPTVDVSGQGAVGATVSLYQGSAPSGSPLQTFLVDSAGNFSGTITLPLGVSTLTATESLDGQTSTNTAPVSVSVVPLVPPQITSPTNGLVMNKPNLTISGKATAGATLIISNVANGATAALATLTVNHSGKFTTTIRLPDGTNVLFAVQSEGGTTSPDSDMVEVVNYLVPEILAQPISQTNFLKGSATFSAVVAGAAPMKLFWQKNGVKIPGATSTKLTLSNLKSNRVAGYNLVASNLYGEVQSAVVALALVSNHFPRLAGNYYGLFAQSNAQFESSGLLTLTLSTMGKFTARILNAGGSYSFSGALSGVGWASNVIPRAGALPPLTVVMDLNVTNNSDQILGTVSAGTNWAASLEANRAAYSATNVFPNHGTYTLVFGNTNGGAQSPGGDGNGTVKVSPSGQVSLSGVLADNTSVAPSAVGVSKGGTFPLYIPLYGKAGSLEGWITFTNQGVNIIDLTNPAPVSFAGSNVAWYRTNADGKLYLHGFTNALVVQGSVFATSANAALLDSSGLAVILSGGDLSAAATNGLTASASGKFTPSGSGIPGLTLSLAPTTGLLRGGFSDPSQRAAAPIKGVIFQDQTNAAGFFLGATNSGLFYLTP